MIDAAQGKKAMPIIGLAIRLSENKVGYLAVNIADVDGVDVVGSRERERDLASEVPVVTSNLDPVSKRSLGKRCALVRRLQKYRKMQDFGRLRVGGPP